jgi:hypothetical protein
MVIEIHMVDLTVDHIVLATKVVVVVPSMGDHTLHHKVVVVVVETGTSKETEIIGYV